MTEIDFALSQNTDTEIVEFVGTVIWNKANEKGSFQNLSEEEKTFVFIDIFESEINNDGLYGFFFNTSGEFSHEVLHAFITINANETASVIDKAIRLFPELPVPKNIMSRRRLMEQLTTKDLELWSNLELDLVNSKEDIVHLIIAYVKKHKANFQY